MTAYERLLAERTADLREHEVITAEPCATCGGRGMVDTLVDDAGAGRRSRYNWALPTTCEVCGGSGGSACIDPAPGYHFEWASDDEWQVGMPEVVADGYGRDALEAAEISAALTRIERELDRLAR